MWCISKARGARASHCHFDKQLWTLQGRNESMFHLEKLHCQYNDNWLPAVTLLLTVRRDSRLQCSSYTSLINLIITSFSPLSVYMLSFSVGWLLNICIIQLVSIQHQFNKARHPLTSVQPWLGGGLADPRWPIQIDPRCRFDPCHRVGYKWHWTWCDHWNKKT